MHFGNCFRNVFSIGFLLVCFLPNFAFSAKVKKESVKKGNFYSRYKDRMYRRKENKVVPTKETVSKQIETLMEKRSKELTPLKLKIDRVSDMTTGVGLFSGIAWGVGSFISYKLGVPHEALDIAIKTSGFSALGLFGSSLLLNLYGPSLPNLRSIDSELNFLEGQKLLLDSMPTEYQVDLGDPPPLKLGAR